MTRLNGVRVSALQTSSKGRWLVLEDGRQLETPLLVAADGARSVLRELAGIEVAEESMGRKRWSPPCAVSTPMERRPVRPS